MSNRNMYQQQCSFEKKTVTINAIVNIGASGAPTLQAPTGPGNNRTLAAAPAGGYGGVKSITRSGTGTYVLTLQDTYQRLLAFWGGIQKDSAPVIVSIQPKATGTNVASLSAPQITFVTYDKTPTIADPINGDVLFIEIELSDSSC